MTGNVLHPASGGREDDPHVRAVVRLDDGSDVAYRDVRRFGTWDLLEPGELDDYLAARRLGVEPLGRAFTAAAWGARSPGAGPRSRPRCSTSGRSRAWGTSTRTRRSGTRGSTRSGQPASWAEEVIAALRQGVRKALRLGIERQGATLRDYRGADGSPGTMQNEFRVYGREDEPCDRCGTPIEKTRVAGRGTWYCPTCQPRD